MAWNFNSPINNMQASVFSALAQHAYNPANSAPAGYTPQNYSDIAGSYPLIHPEVWKDTQGNLIVAFRGTADAADILAAGQLIRGEVPEVAVQARQFAEDLIARQPPGTALILTGHSSGAYQAQYAGIGLENADRQNIHVIGFDGPGMPATEMAVKGVGNYNSVSFYTPGDVATAYTQFANQAQYSGTLSIVGMPNPSPNTVYDSVSDFTREYQKHLSGLSNPVLLAKFAAEAGFSIYDGHKIQALHQHLASSGLTIGGAISAGQLYDGPRLYNIMAEPENVVNTAAILSTLEHMISKVSGFGTSMEFTPLPGITIELNGGSAVVQIDGNATTDWLTATATVGSSAGLEKLYLDNADGSSDTTWFGGAAIATAINDPVAGIAISAAVVGLGIGDAATLTIGQNSSGAVTTADILGNDGLSRVREFDVGDANSWDSHTVATNGGGSVIADIYSYDVVQSWLATHELPTAELFDVEFAAIQSLVTTMEQELFYGLGTGDDLPSPFSPAGGFSTMVFTSASMEIDVGSLDNDPFSSGTTIRWLDPASGYDNSGANNQFGNWELENDRIYVSYRFSFDTDDFFFPVILDLDGDGIDITARADLTVYFDVDNDGYREQTAWVGAGDGLLVIDRAANGGPTPDGLISRADEISFTLGAPGTYSDMEALALNYDAVSAGGNGNGRLDAGDPGWSNFRVWLDANANGQTDANELRTLSSLGIASIGLVHNGQQFMLPDGSMVNGFSNFIYSNGATGVAGDVGFAYDPSGFQITDVPPAPGLWAYRVYTGEDGSQRRINDTRGYAGPIIADVAAGLDGIIAGSGNDNITISNPNGAFVDLKGGSSQRVTGGSGNDVIIANFGTDTIHGGAGDDTVYVGSNNWTFEGGTGYDTVIVTAGGLYTGIMGNGDGGVEAVIGNSRNDNITANATVASFIDGRGGADALWGGSEGDVLIGGTGNDTMSGRNGDDLVVGGAGVDALYGDEGNDRLLGADGNDGLTGGLGDDHLDGGTGVDVHRGEGGNDVYVVDNAADVVTEGANAGTDEVQTTLTSYVLASNVERLKLLGSGANSGTGNTLANVLIGGAGNDFLNGLAGADTMLGGTGGDYYVVDNAGDVVSENADEGTDAVQSYMTYTLGNNVENLYLDNSGGAINGTGNALDNIVTGNSAGNVLAGGTGNDVVVGNAGADTMSGGSGNDRFYVDSAGDVVVENVGEGTDTVVSSITYTLGNNVEYLNLDGTVAINGTGNSLDNTLVGNSGANILAGGAGNDFLNGLAGADTMLGGTGGDYYVVDNAGDVVSENADEGTDAVQSYMTYTLGNNVENLYLDNSGGAINGTGNALDNIVTGNSAGNVLAGGTGNDVVVGNAGADTMSGGSGNDRFYVDSAGDLVVENVGEGTDTVVSSITYTLGNNVEYLNLDGTVAINGTGNSLDNTLAGNTSANVLNGGSGADTMIGGLGDDTFNVDNVGDVVTEYADQGSDAVASSVTYILSSNVENLSLTGTSAINGTGNDLNNRVTGNSVANFIRGGDGADTLDGGSGSDWADYLGATTGLTASLLTPFNNTGEAAGDTYIAIENIRGSDFADNLTGDAGANFLRGGIGADSLDGGANSDWADYATATVGVAANLATGGTGGEALGDIYAAIENIRGSNFADSLTGNAGNNTLRGGLGGDALDGGAGTDWADYTAATAGVTANLSTLAINTGEAAGDTFVSIENLVGTNFGDSLTGDTVNNVFRGGAGADALDGGAGSDWAEYATATAGITANLANPSSNTGDAAGDTYISIENVRGSNWNDTLTGDVGNNFLAGGLGADTLNGGNGLDQFSFDTALNGSTNVDTIVGYVVADDTIRLENAIFATLTTTGTLAAGSFVVGTAAADANDFIVYNAMTGGLFYDADGSGATAQVQFAIVQSDLAIANNDFLIV